MHRTVVTVFRIKTEKLQPRLSGSHAGVEKDRRHVKLAMELAFNGADTHKRMQRFKGAKHGVPPLVGGDMVAFFKQVQRRQPKMEAISRTWQQLVPGMFLEHTCLEGFGNGTLTVLVDSASHLYELRQLMLAGLEKQLSIACKAAGLRKVNLKRGQWYDGQTGAPKF